MDRDVVQLREYTAEELSNIAKALDAEFGKSLQSDRLVTLADHALQTYHHDMIGDFRLPADHGEIEKFNLRTAAYKKQIRKLLSAADTLRGMFKVDTDQHLGDPFREAICALQIPLEINDPSKEDIYFLTADLIEQVTGPLAPLHRLIGSKKTDRPLKGGPLEYITRAVFYYLSRRGIKFPTYGKRPDKTSMTADIIEALALHFGVVSNERDEAGYILMPTSYVSEERKSRPLVMNVIERHLDNYIEFIGKYGYESDDFSIFPDYMPQEKFVESSPDK